MCLAGIFALVISEQLVAELRATHCGSRLSAASIAFTRSGPGVQIPQSFREIQKTREGLARVTDKTPEPIYLRALPMEACYYNSLASPELEVRIFAGSGLRHPSWVLSSGKAPLTLGELSLTSSEKWPHAPGAGTLSSPAHSEFYPIADKEMRNSRDHLYQSIRFNRRYI